LIRGPKSWWWVDGCEGRVGWPTRDGRDGGERTKGDSSLTFMDVPCSFPKYHSPTSHWDGDQGSLSSDVRAWRDQKEFSASRSKR